MDCVRVCAVSVRVLGVGRPECILRSTAVSQMLGFQFLSFRQTRTAVTRKLGERARVSASHERSPATRSRRSSVAFGLFEGRPGKAVDPLTHRLFHLRNVVIFFSPRVKKIARQHGQTYRRQKSGGSDGTSDDKFAERARKRGSPS